LDANQEEIDLKQHFEEDDDIPIPTADFSEDFQSDEEEFEENGYTTGDVENIDKFNDEEDEPYLEMADPDFGGSDDREENPDNFPLF
ncbi:MAG: hypothetical protein K2H82_00875, partial [Oscillospiraceae bacterium]|nr:hypothetical protein [Oscillospiraceae bacterium]